MSVTDLAEWLGLDGAHGRTAIREMESGKRQISGPIRRALMLSGALKMIDAGHGCPVAVAHDALTKGLAA